MKINVNAVHFKADKKLVDFINDKVDKLTLFHNGILSGDVFLKVDNNENRSNKKVEIKVNLRGSDLFAEKKAESFEVATEQAVEALRRQLRKHKDKTQKR